MKRTLHAIAPAGLLLARSAHAAGSELVRVALVGCGIRGTGAAANCLNAPAPTRLVAVADLFESRARTAQIALKSQYGDKVDVPDQRVFSGPTAYRPAIECGADLVILATPPAFRPLQYRAAVFAGRHVFLESPCCIDAPGFQTLVEANRLAAEKGLSVGVGLQRRHDPAYLECVQRLHDGAIGEIHLLRTYGNTDRYWTRQREAGETEISYQVRNWPSFAPFGGDPIVYQHVHSLDVANWLLDRGPDPAKAHPVEVQGMGGRQRAGEFPDSGAVFDHHALEFTYADGTKMVSQCRQMPGCWNLSAEQAHGNKGQATCPGSISGQNGWNYNGPRLNPYDQEHADLLRAILKGEKHHEGWHGAVSSFTAVLARMASYSGQVLRWDEALAKGPSLLAERFELDAPPPLRPDTAGRYDPSVPVPGAHRPW